LFGRRLKGDIVVPVFKGEQRRMKNGRGEWLASTDAHPNSRGVRALGLKTVDDRGLGAFLYGAADVTVVLDPLAHPFLASQEAVQLLRVSPTVAVVRTDHPIAEVASWLLPTASQACNEGTFTSSTGVTQRFATAFAAPGHAKPLWLVLSLLAREMGVGAIDFETPAEIFAAMSAKVPALAGRRWEELGGGDNPPLRGERRHVG
jgi:NADH dehydrogenase/NADH:ubiquinone oxidoreductase subunit G